MDKWTIRHLIKITYFWRQVNFHVKKSKWKAPKTNYAVYATIS